MAQVKVLIEGYAKEVPGGWVASSTTTLILDNAVNVIVDPGANRTLLLANLSKENLAPEDINFVYLTHYHVDHDMLMAIFPNAKVMDDTTIYEEDRETEHDGIIPGTEVKILKTPGHDQFHSSLAVKTDDGVVVVAGDVFWWNDAREQKTDRESLLNLTDPFVKDEKVLLASRKKLLETADWIIPGHGKMFKVK